MLNKIIEYSVRNKLIITLMVMALILVGIYQTTRLPIDAVPDITNNQVQVITVAPSFGATDIERLVTFPIEQANTNIAGLQEIRSFSRFGLSLVTIVFHDDVDIYWARQQVAERLQQVQNEIPKGIGSPTLGPISTGLGEIYQYVVRPQKGYEHKYNLTELRTIQDWVVRRQLLGVKGVAEVSSFGGKLKQYEIAVNPEKLQAYGITIADVFGALENNNENTGGGYIEKGPTVLYIRSEGLIGSIENIENISIPMKDHVSSIFIRDVAEIKESFAPRYGAICYNDEGEVSGAVVMMLKGENSDEVIENVKERIAKIQKTLPKGVIIEPFLDRSKMVNHAISTVEKNLLEGALIVVLVLVLFLGNFRAGLLVASVIPLAMLFAICMMNLFGVSGNLMSLGALDFGLIIDGAVIIVEAVMHQMSKHNKLHQGSHYTNKEVDLLVVDSTGKMMNTAVFGQIIILVVYLPILSLQGIEGKMFKPMAQTVAFALLGAFILSLTYIPMMSSIIFKRKSREKENFSDRFMRKLEQFYGRIMLRVLVAQKKIFAIVIILFVFAIYTLTNMGGEFIPSLEEGDFAVETRVLTGSSLETTIESTQKAAHVLKSQFPEVIKVVTKIGSGEVPTDPMPMDASDMMVILKDKKEWTSASTFPELAIKMGEALKEIPGITAGFQYPVQMRFNELMTGARQDVVVKIFGENLDSLANSAAKLGKIINSVEGAQDLYVEPITGMPQVIIKYNRQMLAQYHISVSEVNKVVNTALAGQSAGMLFEGEKRFDIVVRLNNLDRNKVSNISNLLIPNSMGDQIPLSQLAEVKIEDGPNQIQRENAQRRIVVGFNTKGRDVQSIVEELQKKVEAKLKLPVGYTVTYGGSFENLKKATSRLMIAVPISLALIFLLLFFAFRSLRESFLIYTAIPLSIIGGVFLLAARDMPFSISAGVGFIALFGVAVLNGMVLISEFKRLKLSGMENAVRIIITGTKTRLRPVLMTAAVASLGFLPMALSNGAGSEVQRPLATVVIGGLFTATLLTLFMLPLFYLLFEKGLKFKLKKRKIILSLLLIGLSVTGFSQSAQPITLDQAIEIALQNNRQLKSQERLAEFSKAMIEASNEIKQTQITGEYGQVNSVYIDSRFGISQDFSFPTVYIRQKALSNEEHQLDVLQVSLKAFELKKAVTQSYFNILYWKNKVNVLQYADSLYRNYYNKTSTRFEKGEINILEKTTAENQKSSITIQLKQIQKELNLERLHFQFLLNVDVLYDPLLTNMKVVPAIENNSAGNPSIKMYEQQQIIAAKQTRVEKAKLLPDLMLGYNNNSFKGVGPDDNYYSESRRFSSVQAGISVPIFSQAQRAKIDASKISEDIAQNDLLDAKATHAFKLQSLTANLEINQEIVNYYENTGLKNSNLIRENAQILYMQGDINYLEFVTHMNKSISIESEYLDAVKALNDIVIQINYITLTLK